MNQRSDTNILNDETLIALREVVSRHPMPNTATCRVHPWEFPTGWPESSGGQFIGYWLDGVTPDMLNLEQVEELLIELAQIARRKGAMLFVLTENDTFDETTWNAVGPKSPDWIAYEERLLSLGWMGWTRLGETQTGISTLIGVDARSPQIDGDLVPFPPECKCDRSSYLIDRCLPICGNFVPDTLGPSECANCEHQEACHSTQS